MGGWFQAPLRLAGPARDEDRRDLHRAAVRALRPQPAADHLVEVVARAGDGLEPHVERDRLHERVDLLGEHLGRGRRILEEVEVAGALLGEPAHQADVEVVADADRRQPDPALYAVAGHLHDVRRRGVTCGGVAVGQEDDAVLALAGRRVAEQREALAQPVVDVGRAARLELAHDRVQHRPVEGRAERRVDVDDVVELDQREPVLVAQAVDQRVEADLDLVEPAIARHRAGVIDDDHEVHRQSMVLRGIDRAGDRELQRRLVRAGEPVASHRHPRGDAQEVAAAGRRHRVVVLVEEAVGVERVGARNLTAIEDPAELADVLGAAEADAAARFPGRRRGIAGRGCGAGRREHEQDRQRKAHDRVDSNDGASARRR